MPRPTVFISYSRTCPASPAIAKALYERLDGAGFEPLWDERTLETGDHWRDELVQMLGECDAAVLLLSKNAVTKDWVYHEATILKFRHDFAREIKLLPIWIDGMKPADLGGKFGPLDLTVLQATMGSTETILKSILDVLEEQVLPLAAVGPEAEILATMRGLLTELNWEVVRKLAERVHQQVSALLPEEPRRHIVAHDLARVLQRGTKPRRIAQHFARSTADMPYDAARNLLRLAALSWVPVKAAEMLRDHVEPKRVFLVNGKRTGFTPRHYVRRASCTLEGWPYWTTLRKRGELGDAELKERVRRVLAPDLVSYMTPAEVTFDDLKAELVELCDPSFVPHIVELPPDLPQPDVKAIAEDEDLAAVRFILVSADCAAAAAPPCPKAVVLQPALEGDHEERAFRAYCAGLAILRKAHGIPEDSETCSIEE